MQFLDGVSLEYSNDAYVQAIHSLVHVGRHQQVLGVVERGDALLRDLPGASVRSPVRQWDHSVRSWCSHSDAEDEEEDSNEEEDELPSDNFWFVHPATNVTDSQPEAELGVRFSVSVY